MKIGTTRSAAAFPSQAFCAAAHVHQLNVAVTLLFAFSLFLCLHRQSGRLPGGCNLECLEFDFLLTCSRLWEEEEKRGQRPQSVTALVCQVDTTAASRASLPPSSSFLYLFILLIIPLLYPRPLAPRSRSGGCIAGISRLFPTDVRPPCNSQTCHQ